MIGRILKYDDFFNDAKPNDRFSLIAHIPRSELIANFSSINHKLKAPLALEFNYTLENQINIISTIFQIHNVKENLKYCKVYLDRLSQIFEHSRGGIAIATRTSCLYALNDLLFSKQIEHEEIIGIKFYPQDFEAIFKFLLLSNEDLLNYNSVYDEEITADNLGSEFFEVFMFKEIPNNQYSYVQNPINLLERSRCLFDYIKSKYSQELKEFTQLYQINDAEDYIKIIANGFFFDSGMTNIQAYRVKKTNKLHIARMDMLSKRGGGKPNTGVKKFEFLEIKKAPLYKLEGAEGKDEDIYILMDNTFLIEKCYDLFFWDFYFDVLKPKGIKIEDWGSEVGKFFEEYSDTILRRIFDKQKDINIKSTNELVVKGVEYADFLIRRKRQIVLIQAKRTFLPQIKYKEVYSLEDYKEINKEEFYERFGLNQIVDMSIARINEYLYEVDPNTPKSKLFIYPVLLINEPIISMGITTYIFNKKFYDLMNEKRIPLESKEYRISRLVILHIGELERLQKALKKRSIKLDQFLAGYASSTDIKQIRNPYAQFQTLDNYIRKKVKAGAIPDYLMQGGGIIQKLVEFGQKSAGIN
ncbi:hypothetical protein [Muriicola jejuensis]|uniref:Uncharacterized protein n=1 Tax=Muriicola jejuensis TaxID=504488 RepID=A0A6P0UE32_9FLAO|nr:hypothetical protein [Muriicola jejuensis]NER09988.1 hypothetical protein [Muriicola jejuensis]